MISEAETMWLRSLNIPTIIPQYNIKLQPNKRSIKVDGYDPITNTVFLFHGDYYHGNPTKFSRDFLNKKVGKTMGQLYDATMVYEKSLMDKGYNVVTIWESDWRKLNRQV